MKMSKKEIKEHAQLEIMNMVANAWTSFHEQNYSHEQREEIEKEIEKQADRIAKMFGYEKAWHN